MSSPPITVSPDATIGEAAKKMRDNKIRRLLVEKNHQKLGTIVESDIIGVDPELHFVIREKSKLEPQFRARLDTESWWHRTCDVGTKSIPPRLALSRYSVLCN